MAKNQDRKSKRREEVENGIIAAQYTQNGWFIKIYPAFSIDLVKFAFVQKGKNGEGFNIYMSVDKFDLWCDDILNFRMQRVIEKEKADGEKYPKAYKYVTGESGSKSIGLCPSTVNGNFATFNGSIVSEGKKVYANVPVDYDWLRIMAKWFKKTLEVSGYMNNMAGILLKASEQYRSQVDQKDAEESTQHAQDEQHPAPAAKKKETAPAEKAERVPKDKQDGEYDKKERLTGMHPLTNLKSQKGSYYLTCTDNKNRKKNVVFLADAIDRIDSEQWQRFIDMLEKQGKLAFEAEYHVKNGTYYFNRFSTPA